MVQREESEFIGISFIFLTGTWTYQVGKFKVSGQIRMQTYERASVLRCTACLSILVHVIQLSAHGETCPYQLSCSLDILICLLYKGLIFPFLLGICQLHYTYIDVCKLYHSAFAFVLPICTPALEC